MLHKAKLYSLLAILIASTVVSLFGFSGSNTYAQEGGVTWDGENIWYDDNPYQNEGTLDAATAEVMGLPAGVQWFRYMYSDPDDDNRTKANIIYFNEGETTATHVHFSEYNIFSSTYTKGETKTLTIPARGDPTTGGGTGEDGETPSSCEIKGIGWLICPIVNFLAEVTDASYNVLDKTLLRVEPIALPGASQDSGMQLYEPWKMMRDFANVLFIIAFLIIVFSQITNIGISNYGIKRLLPKIIVAAILVNISYFICAVAVDLSNILGNTLRGLLMPNEGILLKFNFEHEGESFTGTGWQGLAGIVVGAAAVATLVYVFLPVFLPLMLGAALSVITVVIALTLRQALIVILIVISPLAFVALLLPNTEGLFQKWKSLFTAMLMVYPIVSVVFGASALASNILMKSTNDWPTQMVGAGVSVIPLFITPIIMKVSGGLLNRWVGLVNDPAKGPIDGMRKGVEGKAKRLDNRRKAEALRGGGKRYLGGRYQRQAKSAAIDTSLEAGAKRAEARYVSEQAQEDKGFQNTLAGGTSVPLVGGKTIPDWVPGVGGKDVPDIVKANPEALQSALAGAINVEARLEAEEVSAANAIITKLDLSKDQVQQLAMGRDATDTAGNVVLRGAPNSSLQTAAIQQQFKGGDVSLTDQLMSASGAMETSQRQAVVEGMAQMSSRVLHYGKAAQEEVGKGNVNSDADIDRIAAENYIEKGKAASSGVLTNNDKVALERYGDLIAGTKTFTDSRTGATRTVNAVSAAQTREAAHDTLRNPNVPQPSDEIRWRIDAIDRGMNYPTYETARVAGAVTLPPRPR